MSPSQSLRILVVEDDADERALLAVVLMHTGEHTLAFATSGEQGLELLRAGRYDLVMTDIGLPEMSGFEMLLQSEREGFLVEETVVLVCSAKADARCPTLLHAAQYLPKPVDTVEIRAIIGAHVGALVRARARV